jgi:hypothetical protein
MMAESRMNRRAVKIACAIIGGWIFALVLSSCTSVRTSDAKSVGLHEPDVDPLACIGISLKADIQVTKEVFHERSIMPDRYLVVLRYREGGDEKQLTPELEAGYNNVSIVSEVAAGTDNPMIVFRRYCVVEMWRFIPHKNQKYCYLWTIGDDTADMKVMLEGLGGEFLDERIVPLGTLDIAKLRTFATQLTRTIIDMMKEPIAHLSVPKVSCESNRGIGALS